MMFDDVKQKLVCGKCGGKEFGMIKSPHATDKRRG